MLLKAFLRAEPGMKTGTITPEYQKDPILKKNQTLGQYLDLPLIQVWINVHGYNTQGPKIGDGVTIS